MQKTYNVETLVRLAPTSEFHRSLYSDFTRYGGLTQPQIDALNGTSSRAQVVDLGHIEASFNTALANGVRKPTLYLGDFRIERAPDSGRNPGAIYVTRPDGIRGMQSTYLGKIVGGKFHPVKAVPQDVVSEVVRVCTNPFESAVQYGRLKGRCSICSRTLTDPDSIAAAIGPICRAKFGW